jgi:hypothetical protein
MWAVLNLNPCQMQKIETPRFKSLFVDGPVQVSMAASVELMAEVLWAYKREVVVSRATISRDAVDKLICPRRGIGRAV